MGPLLTDRGLALPSGDRLVSADHHEELLERYSREELDALLLSAAADVHVRYTSVNSWQGTVLDIARAKGHTAIAELLEAAERGATAAPPDEAASADELAQRLSVATLAPAAASSAAASTPALPLDEMTDEQRREAKRKCSWCGLVAEEKLGSCNACKQVRYCCTEHQAAHWAAGHKQECKGWRRARQQVEGEE